MSHHRVTRGLIVAFTLLVAAIAQAADAPPAIEGRTMTLAECLDLGLRVNPTVEVARQGLKANQERVGEAAAGYYPTLKLSSGYTYSTPSERMPGLTTDSYDTRLAVRQTLFDAGATKNQISGVRHTITAQSHEVDKSELDIAHAIRTAFVDTLKREALLAVTKTALQGTERHLAQATALYQEGLSARSDVIKSEVQVSAARLEVVKADNAVLSAKAALAAAMGVPVTVRFTIDGRGRAVEDSGHSPLQSTEGAKARAYQLRPELKGLKAKLQASDATIHQAESGYFPAVSLDAAYGWQEENFLPTERRWNVGVTVAIPVFERLTTRSKVGQAEANRAGLKATEIQALRTIELEVEQAWLALSEARERRTLTQKTEEQASEDLRVSEGRYQEGLATVIEVIDSQTALTTARANAVVAAFDIELAQARLDRATGTRRETSK